MKKLLGIGEYANYLVDENGRLSTYISSKESFYNVEPIVKITAGHPWGLAVGASGAVYLVRGASTQVVKTNMTGKAIASYWNYHAVVGLDGSLTVFNEGMSLIYKMRTPAKVKMVKAAADLVILTEDGKVYEYEWMSGARAFKPSLETLTAKAIPLPGVATWITTSRSLFSAAIVNGDPYVWNDAYGAPYVLAKGAQGPTNMAATWKLTEKIIQIEASDHTLHAITASNRLGYVGDVGIGGGGDGAIDPRTLASTAGWDMAWRKFVTQFTYIGGNRTYDMIFAGNSYGFRKGARELSGQISTWGYAKFGLLGNGIQPVDDPANVGITANPTITRVEFPATMVMKTTAQLKTMVADKTYPPKEPGVINLPPTANAGADVTLTLPVDSYELIGNASDPDGQVVSAEWEKASGPGVTLQGNVLTGLQEGDYVFRYTVTDDKGAKTSDTKSVKVLPKPRRLLVTILVYDDATTETL